MAKASGERGLLVDPVIFELIISNKGLSIKVVCSVGEGGCPVLTFCGQGGKEVLQMRTSALFGTKNINFFRNLWCVRTDKEGWSQCRQGGIDFVRTSFMNGPLFTINCKLESIRNKYQHTQKKKLNVIAQQNRENDKL